MALDEYLPSLKMGQLMQGEAYGVEWGNNFIGFMDSGSVENPVVLNVRTPNSSFDVGNLRAGAIGINDYIQSDNFVSGSDGWKIDGDGNCEFNDGTFRGDLIAGSIHIPDTTSSGSFHVDSTGNMWSGATSFAAAPAKLSSAGEFTLSGGTITGATIQTATSGQRVVMNSSGLSIYDSSNVQIGYINNPSSPYNTAGIYFKGDDKTLYTGIVTGGSNKSIYSEQQNINVNKSYYPNHIYSRSYITDGNSYTRTGSALYIQLSEATLYNSLGISSIKTGTLDISNCDAQSYLFPNVNKTYKVKITDDGTPNKFQYSDDGGVTWNGSDISVTTSLISLSNGVKIQFTGGTTGGVIDDEWTFNTGAVTSDDEVGLRISNNRKYSSGRSISVGNSGTGSSVYIRCDNTGNSLQIQHYSDDDAISIQNFSEDSGHGISISNESDGNAIDIYSTGTGKDIDGTSSNWSVASDGDAVFQDLQTNGNTTLGNASTDTITCTGRLIVRTAASDPQDGTPANRPAGSVAEIVYYSGKLYFCTNSSTPTWELITSS